MGLNLDGSQINRGGLSQNAQTVIREKTSDAPSSEIPIDWLELKETLEPGSSAETFRHLYDNQAKEWDVTVLQETLHDPFSLNYGLQSEILPARFNPASGRYETISSQGLRRPVVADADIALGAEDATVSVWTGDPLADSGENIADVHNTWMDAEVKSGDELWAEFLIGAKKWHIVGQQTKAAWIRVTFNAAFTTSNANVAATVDIRSEGPLPTGTVTVENMRQHTSSTYVFEGDSGDYGMALYRPADGKYYLVQVECP